MQLLTADESVHREQGQNWLEQGNLREAQKAFSSALEEAKRFGLDDPRYGQALNDLAVVMQQRGDYASAEAFFREGLSIMRKALPVEDLKTSRVLGNLGNLLRIRGRYLEADRLLRQSLTTRLKKLGPDHVDVAWSYVAIGALHVHRKEFSRAIPLFKRALLIRERSLGPEHPHVAVALSALAATYIYCGQYSEADELLRRAFTIAQRPGGEQHMTEILGNLGTSAAKQGRYGEAENYYHQTIQICERLGAPRHATVVAALSSLGHVYLNLRQYARAEDVLRRSLEIGEETGPNHPQTAAILIRLAEALRKLRRGQEARAYDRMARTMRNQHMRENLTDFVIDVQSLRR